MAHSRIYIPLTLLTTSTLFHIRNNSSVKFIKHPIGLVRHSLDPDQFGNEDLLSSDEWSQAYCNWLTLIDTIAEPPIAAGWHNTMKKCEQTITSRDGSLHGVNMTSIYARSSLPNSSLLTPNPLPTCRPSDEHEVNTCRPPISNSWQPSPAPYGPQTACAPPKPAINPMSHDIHHPEMPTLPTLLPLAFAHPATT
jgi:hypothetical protein